MGYGDGFACCISVACPNASHAEAHDVRPCGTSPNRIAALEIAATAQIVRSIPAGCTEIFSPRRLGAGPRAARRPLPRRQLVLLPAADAPARDTENSAADGIRGPIPSSAKSGPHANVANAGLLPGTLRCNTALADAGAEIAARSLSADTVAALASDKNLAAGVIVRHDQEDPREPLLPKVRSRRQRLIVLRDDFYLSASPIAFFPNRLIDASSDCQYAGHPAAIDSRRPPGGVAARIIRCVSVNRVAAVSPLLPMYRSRL